MSKLHELAERMGVETRAALAYGDKCGDVTCADCYAPRSDLEIAHDMLAKLQDNETRSLRWYGGNLWYAHLSESEAVSGSFIECVCELASRHK